MTLPVRYLKLLSAVGISCALFAVPSVARWFMDATDGYGAGLMLPLPSLFFLLLAAAPAVFFWPRHRLPLATSGAITAAAVLLLPQYIADRALARDLALHAPLTVKNPLTRKGDIGVEIHRRGLSAIGPYDPRLHAPQPCLALCRDLLKGGDVAWVRIVMTDGAGIAPVSTMLVAATGADCKQQPRCTIHAKDHGERADLRFDIDERARNDVTAFYQPTGLRSVTWTDLATGDILFHQTQLFHRRPTQWIAFDISGNPNGDAPRGIGLLRRHAATAPIDLVGPMRALGLTLASADAEQQVALD